MDWRSEFEAEMENARQARARGNEGRARVCARRAAGVVVREWLRRRGRSARTPSAYDLLRDLLNTPDLDAEARAAAEALVARVDEEFRLPPGVDLLALADRLRHALLDPQKTQ